MTDPNNVAKTRVVHYEHLASTNAEAIRLAHDGERGPLWIVADVQTEGRGRSGRAWQSLAGNLHASYLFTTSAEHRYLYQLSLVAGVAVIEAVLKIAPQPLRGLSLKWPNDLLVGSAKAGGILVESTVFSDQTVAVIGIGLNVATAPAVENVATAALGSVIGTEAPLAQIQSALSKRLTQWIRTWDNGRGFEGVRQTWLGFGPAIGTPVTVKDASTIHAGEFAGLDGDGSLLIKTPGGALQRHTHGDMSIVD